MDFQILLHLPTVPLLTFTLHMFANKFLGLCTNLFFFNVFPTQHHMQDLYSLIKEQTHALCSEKCRLLTTDPPRKSLHKSLLYVCAHMCT